jgi:arylsulfatase A-like enzyme
MSQKLSRRDFLKIATLLGLSTFTYPALARISDASTDKPNVLILVFDTLSALHLSLYGYRRETSPHMTRFAERATVYNAHYSAGNFTTPGTASIFTGTYPWTHRAIHADGTVSQEMAPKNIYRAFGEQGYTSLAFSHNQLANILHHQFRHDIHQIVPPGEIALVENAYADGWFPRDYGIAIQSERSFLEPVGELPNSLFLHLVLKHFRTKEERNVARNLHDDFPRGVPHNHDIFYTLKHTYDWLVSALHTLPTPYLTYFHVMPPHDPYTPRVEFVDLFDDGWSPAPKPTHFFTEGREQDFLDLKRREYDEYIGYVDAEFGRLIDNLTAEGLLENTWVVVTSDHGELFERGIFRHSTPTLYEPLLRVPLMISAPGQQQRHDVNTITSSVDLLPTLLHIIGGPIPEWTEGILLPPHNGIPIDPKRPVFALEATRSPKSQPLRTATAAIIKGKHKLVHYMGFSDHNQVSELYDLEEDPEERNDLVETHPDLADELISELMKTLKS